MYSRSIRPRTASARSDRPFTNRKSAVSAKGRAAQRPECLDQPAQPREQGGEAAAVHGAGFVAQAHHGRAAREGARVACGAPLGMMGLLRRSDLAVSLKRREIRPDAPKTRMINAHPAFASDIKLGDEPFVWGEQLCRPGSSLKPRASRECELTGSSAGRPPPPRTGKAKPPSPTTICRSP